MTATEKAPRGWKVASTPPPYPVEGQLYAPVHQRTALGRVMDVFNDRRKK